MVSVILGIYYGFVRLIFRISFELMRLTNSLIRCLKSYGRSAPGRIILEISHSNKSL